MAHRQICSSTKKTKFTPYPIISQDDRKLIHPIEKANEFNTYFSSILSINGDPELP